MRSPPQPALIVMAKWPAPGRVKTRLTPPLSAEEAASLYRAMLLDVTHGARALAMADVLVGYHPAERRADFAALLPPEVTLVPQRGGHLAARMGSCFEQVFAQGYGPVLMRNSDAPTLPGRIIAGAIEALAAGADVVFSPDASKGYGVIGLARSRPLLFAEPLESENSYEETLTRCRAAALKVAEVESWYDVDRPEDLRRLIEDWKDGHTGAHLRAFLGENRRGERWQGRIWPTRPASAGKGG